ncbi:hypothetical protein [Cohnella yongneupensis]|uniref:VCBS repeat-containing protein n=1 Tax=Cohnella yongneupensis TaxID=425006 RepID=A0ABW0R0F7_9BACL
MIKISWRFNRVMLYGGLTIGITAYAYGYGDFFAQTRNEPVTVDEYEADGLRYALVNEKGMDAYGDRLVVERVEQDGRRQRVYENDFKDLKPWKIEVADVDGDRRNEIIIAVNKTTHFDEQAKNYAGNLLSIPGDELMFIERMADQGERIAIYYWLDFGFALLAES